MTFLPNSRPTALATANSPSPERATIAITEKGDACFQAMLRLHHSRTGGQAAPPVAQLQLPDAPAEDDVEDGDLVWSAHLCAALIFPVPTGTEEEINAKKRSNRRKVYRLAQKYRETGKGIPFVALESMNTICLSRVAYKQYITTKTARAR